MNVVLIFLEAFVLAASLSLDAFVASFAYGSDKIKIPFSSVLVISSVCSGFLGISLFLGALVRPWLPSGASSLICFLILFSIGLIKLLDNLAKSFIRKHGALSKNIRFSLLNFKFVLNVYANPEKADADFSKSISFGEAFTLAVALSLDGMAAGFGAALGDVNGAAVFFSSLITGTAAVVFGSWLGNKLADRLRVNVSWMSGAILILLAILKMMKS